MKIEHVNGDGEKITWGWTAKAIVTALAAGFVALSGFLFQDRLRFERRLTILEEIAAQQSRLIQDKKEEHQHFVTRAEFLVLQERIDGIAAGVSRLEDALVFDRHPVAAPRKKRADE